MYVPEVHACDVDLVVVLAAAGSYSIALHEGAERDGERLRWAKLEEILAIRWISFLDNGSEDQRVNPFLKLPQ